MAACPKGETRTIKHDIQAQSQFVVMASQICEVIFFESVKNDIFLDKNIYRRGGPALASRKGAVSALRSTLCEALFELSRATTARKVLREGLPLRIDIMLIIIVNGINHRF